MRHRQARLLAFLSMAGVLVLLYLIATSPTPVFAQVNCTAYNTQCPALQAIISPKVQGPIKYWFDDDRINAVMTNPSHIANLKERVKLAADDWVQRTGVSIMRVDTLAQANVRIYASAGSSVVNGLGQVDHDPTYSDKTRIQFSYKWGEWTDAGRDRLASHEWGHVLGFDHFPENQCSTVESIMRQFSGTTATAENQLKGITPMPAPARPNHCDICAAKDKQANQPLGTTCPTPTPTPTPDNNAACATFLCYTPTPEEEVSFQWEFCCAYTTPVVVDVAGDGFALTDAAGGVLFDIRAVGSPRQISWTVAGSDDSWLALDRSGNGLIDDGAELFGSHTPQPAPPSGHIRNGFLALAEYDKLENGGNSDGVIDAGDAIYTSLRLWRDENHNGFSEPDELRGLASHGISALALDYKESRRRDRHGNMFRYRAKIYSEGGARGGRLAYDVFLLSAP